MKKSLGMVAVVVIGLMGCRSDSKPVQTATVQKKLSDNYATSALLALKAIQRDPYAPAKGSKMVSRFTQEKIDAADVIAVSSEERNVTTALNSVYLAQLNLNQHKAQLERDGNEIHTLDANNKKLSDAWVKLMTTESAAVKSLSADLDACYVDFDALLRARLTDVPASCASEQK